MPRPNFFIAGAPRCGTASMYAYLKQHPEVYVSIHKEPHFFGSDLQPASGWIRDEPLYLGLFAGAGNRARRGEASVWYLSSERAPHEIRAFSPEARIVVQLRDPVQMSHSLYSLYTRTGNEDLPTFEEALAAEPERRLGRRIPPGAYYPAGLLYTDVARYAAQVERYLAVFGREAVHCIVFDDLVRDTAAVYRRTLEFLGVDPGFEAELDPRRANERIRLLAVRQLRHTPPEVRRLLGYETSRQHEGASRQPLSEETAARLRRLFAGDVERLGALLGRDLAAWSRGEPVPAPAPPPRRSQARLQGVLESVRILRRIPPETRALYQRGEPLERMFARWQKMRVPELSLEQRPGNPAWGAWFAGERERLAAALGAQAARIEHFGSTAVPGLSSKNVIDVAVGLASAPGPEVEAALAGLGYESYGNGPVDAETLWFWRIESDRAFVLHVCDDRRSWITEQVTMREYLRAFPAERDRYAGLKRELAAEKDTGLLHYSLRKLGITIDIVGRAERWKRDSGAGEAGRLDHQALVGAGADDARGSRHLHLEAEQPVAGHLRQPDADGHCLARPRGAYVGDVNAGADRGLPLHQPGLDQRQAGVLDQRDHARGREDAVQVGRAHVGGDLVGRLVDQAGGEGIDEHD